MGRAGFVDDGGADQVAPLGPGAVVVADLVEVEQILQHESSVGAALADAAIGDDFVFAVNPLGFVEFFQVVVGLESAVFLGGLRPGDVRGSGNVPGTLCCFREAWRGENFSSEFINGANVNELAGLAPI